MPPKVKVYTGKWSRGIVIGDIHGCIKQLKSILRKTNFSNSVTRSYPSILEDNNDSNTLSACGEINSESTDDLCIFVGDLVNKGPDSYACVRLLKAIGAVGVQGNHDRKLLLLSRGNLAREEKSSLLSLSSNCPHDILEYLDSLPHIIYLPMWKVIVVHAGLDPTLPLSSQSIDGVLHMRYLASPSDMKKKTKYLSSSDYFFAIEKKKIGKRWFRVWNEVMKGNFKEKVTLGEAFFNESLVVYGHDAYSSFQKNIFSIGLDSGCVYGGELTALVLPGRHLVQTPGLNSLSKI